MLSWTFAFALAVWAGIRLLRGNAVDETGVAWPALLSAAFALAMVGWATKPQRRAFGFWAALAVVGQAASLQMIDAGIRLHYQHYRPLAELLAGYSWYLLLVVVQAVAVGIALVRKRTELYRWLRRHFGWWQLAGLGAVLWLPAATVSEDVRFFAAELVFAALIQTVNLANIVLIGWSLPDGMLAAARERWSHWLNGDSGGRLDRFVTVAALWVVVVAALLSYFSYQRHPHIPDEVVYLYHARYLADGMLTMPAPEVKPAFDVYLMYWAGDRWFSCVPLGWPLVLAAGAFFGAPWLVNPLLGGLCVVLAYLVIDDLYDLRTARLSVFLLCVSPWFVFMAMNFMTHMLTLAGALAAVFALSRSRATGSALWSLAGGLAVGMVGLTRPLEGLMFAVLLGLWTLGVGGKRLRLTAIVAYGLGGMLVGAVMLGYNYLLTGDPASFPIMAYVDENFGPNANALGFGPDRGMGWAIDPNPGHSPLDALINSNLNAFSINIEMFGWATGSLFLAGLFLLTGRLSRSDLLLLTVIASTYMIHFFYYFSGGPDFGARYWFPMLIPLVVLSVRGLFRLESMLGERDGIRVRVVVLLLGVMAVVSYFSWRAADKYYHYQQMSPEVLELSREHEFGRSLVLVRGDAHPDYASAAAYNPTRPSADAPLYAWDRDPEVRRQVLEAFGDRPVWIIEGPTRSGKGFHVVAGPLNASSLLEQEQ